MPETGGIEKDGSESDLYCKFCYKEGDFVNPGMTLEEMKNRVIVQMRTRGIPENIIRQSLNVLPQLNRWVEKIGTQYEDGVLQISLPRKEEAKKITTKQIALQ